MRDSLAPLQLQKTTSPGQLTLGVYLSPVHSVKVQKH